MWVHRSLERYKCIQRFHHELRGSSTRIESGQAGLVRISTLGGCELRLRGSLNTMNEIVGGRKTSSQHGSRWTFS
jgi:hypothetical protein